MCSKPYWIFEKSPAYMSLFHPTRLFNLRKSSYLHDYSILHNYLILLWKSLILILTNSNYTRVKNNGWWVYIKEIFLGTKLILKEGKFIHFNKNCQKNCCNRRFYLNNWPPLNHIFGVHLTCMIIPSYMINSF